jgi:hypothetical protein
VLHVSVFQLERDISKPKYGRDCPHDVVLRRKVSAYAPEHGNRASGCKLNNKRSKYISLEEWSCFHIIAYRLFSKQ